MHAAEREKLILELLNRRGFLSFQDLNQKLEASPATLRRDLDRLESAGQIVRVRGGARLAEAEASAQQLGGVPFHENIGRFPQQKAAIGRVAASLCRPGESVIIDGGSTTLQMCPLLEPLGLNVLSNSLHIVRALLPQTGTRVSMPAGALFREQDILLSPFDEDGMGSYHASKLFMGAAAVGPHGLMQSDTLLIQAERRALARSDELIVLVDSSKFQAPAGHVLCGLDEIDVLITDDGISKADAEMVKSAGIKLIIAPLAG